MRRAPSREDQRIPAGIASLRTVTCLHNGVQLLPTRFSPPLLLDVGLLLDRLALDARLAVSGRSICVAGLPQTMQGLSFGWFLFTRVMGCALPRRTVAVQSSTNSLCREVAAWRRRPQGPSARLPPLVQAMLRPSFYPHSPPRVRLVQTHASWVFLAGDRVYKVKKPVDFGFLDFSTPARRARACRREVELNRRLAPGVYLGVVPIYRIPLGLPLCQRGGWRKGESRGDSPCPPRGAWSSTPSSCGCSRRSGCSRRCWRAAPPAPPTCAASRAGSRPSTPARPPQRRAGGGWRRSRRACGRTSARPSPSSAGPSAATTTCSSGTTTATSSSGGGRCSRSAPARGASATATATCTPSTSGSGAPACSSTTASSSPTGIRQCDVAADIAFLYMDLLHHRRPDLAAALMEEYLRRTGDWEVRLLVPFYACYRAVVREKVESLRLADPGIDARGKRAARRRAAGYFRLARELARRDARPRLILVGGLPGSGKSTVARAFAARIGATCLSSDPLRKELAGAAPSARLAAPVGAGIYRPALTALTYRELLLQAERLLRAGRRRGAGRELRARRGPPARGGAGARGRRRLRARSSAAARRASRASASPPARVPVTPGFPTPGGRCAGRCAATSSPSARRRCGWTRRGRSRCAWRGSPRRRIRCRGTRFPWSPTIEGGCKRPPPLASRECQRLPPLAKGERGGFGPRLRA